MELLLSNPLLTVVVAIVCVLIGKYVWVSKEDEKKINNDISHVAQQHTLDINATKEDITSQIHALELSYSEKMGEHKERMRIIQKEILDEVTEKFCTKETAYHHEDRIAKLEETLEQMREMCLKVNKIETILAKQFGQE